MADRRGTARPDPGAVTQAGIGSSWSSSFPGLDPATSAFSCCLRFDDVTAFFEDCLAAGIPEASRGWPRVHRPTLEDSGLLIGALIDPDCTLLLIQNP